MLEEKKINLPRPSERTQAWTLEELETLRRMPFEERRRILEEAAELAASDYEEKEASQERALWQSGDIVEY